jgi:hypothetical protein
MSRKIKIMTLAAVAFICLMLFALTVRAEEAEEKKAAAEVESSQAERAEEKDKVMESEKFESEETAEPDKMTEIEESVESDEKSETSKTDEKTSNGELEDTDKSGTVKINYVSGTDGNVKISGAAFRLYYLASLSSDGSYSLLGDLDTLKKGENITGEKANAWNMEKIQVYINDNQVFEQMDGKTGEDGILIFNGLNPGLYFCEETEAAEGYEVSQPLLLAVPYTLEEGDKSYWQWSVDVWPKACKSEEKSQSQKESVVTSTRKSSVKTGDESRGGFYFCLLLGCLGMGLLGYFMGRRR